MVFKYIIGLIIGYFLSVILSIVLTVLRVGLPGCKCVIEDADDNISILAGKELRKRYIISLLIWVPIILVIVYITTLWIDSIFIGCMIALLIQSIALIRKTGNTKINIDEFNNSLECNRRFIENKIGNKEM